MMHVWDIIKTNSVTHGVHAHLLADGSLTECMNYNVNSRESVNIFEASDSEEDDEDVDAQDVAAEEKDNAVADLPH